MKKTIEVVAALIEKNGKFLLAQRFEHDAYGLLWEFPGGKVEPEETDEQAIIREIKEELALEIEAGGMVIAYSDEAEHLKINVRLYKCNIKNNEPKALECKTFGWFSPEQAQNLELAPADRKALAFLQRLSFKKLVD